MTTCRVDDHYVELYLSESDALKMISALAKMLNDSSLRLHGIEVPYNSDTPQWGYMRVRVNKK